MEFLRPSKLSHAEDAKIVSKSQEKEKRKRQSAQNEISAYFRTGNKPVFEVDGDGKLQRRAIDLKPRSERLSSPEGALKQP